MSRLSFPILALSFAAACACQTRQGQVAAPAGAPAAPTPGLAPDSVVARVDGQPITARELDTKLKGPLARAESEHVEKLHELRAGGLEEMIDARLIEKQAKAEKMTSEALLAREVESGIPEPTEEEMHTLYQQAKDAGQNLPPFDDVKDEIVKFIKDQKRKEKLAAFHEQLRGKAKVENLLPEPALPRVEVAAVGPSRGGAAGAKVTIVEFSDYECPFCHRVEPTVKQVLESYKDQVRIVYREFPLPGHRHAAKASEAALCALDQNKYWEMHDKLFSVEELEVPALKGYAKELGLDSAKFDQCLDSGAKKTEVAASLKAGEEAGVTGTPAFFINGVQISGAVPFEKLKEVIDAELKL